MIGLTPALALVLATAPLAPPLAPPPLEAPGEPGVDPIDHSLDAPPPPPRYAAKSLMIGGGALFVGGIIGAAVSPHCATRDVRGQCVDPQGSADLFPVLMAAGIALGVIGGALWRHDAPQPEP